MLIIQICECFLFNKGDNPDHISPNSTELNLHRLDTTELDKHEQFKKESDENDERQHSQAQPGSIPANSATAVAVSPSHSCDGMVTIHKVCYSTATPATSHTAAISFCGDKTTLNSQN